MMDFSAVCRMCLGTKFLNPIFANSVDHKRYSLTIFVTTGIKVNLNDGLPQQMCAHCVYNLNNSLKFRKQCKHTENKLLQVQNENNTKGGIRVEGSDGFEINEDELELNDDIKIELKCETEKTVVTKEEICIKSTQAELKTDDKLDKREDELTKDQDDPLYQATKKTKPSKQKKCTMARVKCPLCQKDLSVRSLDAHMAKRHPGADDRRDKCELCDRCIIRDKMNWHMIMMHGSKNYKCGYCGAIHDSYGQLLEHVPRCTVKKNTKRESMKCTRELVECEVCHKKMQRASLRVHVRIKHAGLGPVCEHCGRRFGNNLRLGDHLRARHGYEKFKCSVCEFASSSRVALKNHERRHRGEKPFVCEACGAKFHAPYLLVQHRQSHRTERNVKCNLCTAVFKTGNSLHAHRLSCHGASLHRCTVCARAYSCRHYAVKHMRTVHAFKGPVPALKVVKSSSET